MAKQLKADSGDEAATRHHNIEAINKTIADAMDEVLALDRKIAEEKERHIKPLQDARKKKVRQMKADTNVSIQAFNAHYRVFKLNASAEDMTEEDDAGKLRDDLKIVYDAMAAGGQLDWVDAVQPEAAAAE
jgi:hypothetical protein